MWICENCSEEVPDNFSVCWNCQNERGTSGLNPVGEPEVLQNKLTINEYNNVNFDKITTAGKNLKQAVMVYIISIPAALLLLIATEMFDSKNSYILLILLGIIVNIIVLSKIYFAGDSLQKSIEPNSDNKSTKQDTKTTIGE